MNSIRENLQLINNFSKVDGYKINSSRSEAFLYTNDKQEAEKQKEMERNGKAKNNIKYLDMTVTIQIKALCYRNIKFLKKKIHGDLRRWKIFYAL